MLSSGLPRGATLPPKGSPAAAAAGTVGRCGDAMDRARDTHRADAVVQPARPRFGRRGKETPPQAWTRELEPIALGPQPKSARARVLRNVALVTGAGVLILALKLAIPALARDLPGCASQQVRDVLVATVRRELAAKGIARASVGLAGARELAAEDGRRCRAELRVEASTLAIEYDIAWSNWLLGRFVVDARPARP
jgi:hypothetical protein